MEDKSIQTTPSGQWSGEVKTVVGLTLVALLAALLIRFRSILPPLLVTFILTYLLHPVVEWLSRPKWLSWRAAVNIVFFLLTLLTISAFTAIGVVVVQQLQNLIRLLNTFINQLPALALEWSTQVFIFGPFQVNMADYLQNVDLQATVQQVISVVQPLLGQAGGVLATLAAGTASLVGQVFFILLISYFILGDMGKVRENIGPIEFPESLAYDLQRMGRELGRIWNAFLRGQVVLFALTALVYLVLLTVLGVRNVFVLALLAGLARFVPYIGQWVTWGVLVVVTLFQENIFGLQPWQFTLLVVGLALVVDQVMDNLVAPRILGETLGVHPAAVLVAAIIALNLLGLVGVVLAAPVLATLTLVGRYVLRKMLDLDPWPQDERRAPRPLWSPPTWLLKVGARLRRGAKKIAARRRR
ncbi:MAG: AI-2E family transporter [Anaerolineae bacterium]|nr:MAG: AI-2E family transporter [Anaerolineae bacterium]